MYKAVRADAHFVSYFNTPDVNQALQKYLLAPGDSSQIQYIMAYLYEASLDNLITFDTNIISSLHYVHQSPTCSFKDVITIFKNIIKNTGYKLLIKHSKDIFKFAFEAVELFKSERESSLGKSYSSKPSKYLKKS